VEELLPNRLIGAGDGRFESVSSSVVIGAPTGVRPGETTVRLTTWGGLAESEALAAQVEALGRSVWFLGGVDGDGVHWVPWDGGAVAAVGDDGSLSFPLLPEARGAASWTETYRLDCLRALAAQPDQQVPFAR
jgi:hypothetical protein